MNINSSHFWIPKSYWDPLITNQKEKKRKENERKEKKGKERKERRKGKERSAWKMTKVLPALVYLLLFFTFLLARRDLGDGWCRERMMSSCCQANCMEKEGLTCSPFKMIDSVAAHSSSGSSWPALLSPLRGDLVSTACALLATAAASGSVCNVG